MGPTCHCTSFLVTSTSWFGPLIQAPCGVLCQYYGCGQRSFWLGSVWFLEEGWLLHWILSVRPLLHSRQGSKTCFYKGLCHLATGAADQGDLSLAGFDLPLGTPYSCCCLAVAHHGCCLFRKIGYHSCHQQSVVCLKVPMWGVSDWIVWHLALRGEHLLSWWLMPQLHL